MRRNLLYDGFLIQPRSVARTRRRNKSYRTQDRGSTEFSTAGNGLRIVNGFKEILLIWCGSGYALRMNVIQVLLPTIAVSWQHDWRKIPITLVDYTR